MQTVTEPLKPRTTADLVFDHLREEIISLKILPRTKISEAEVAKRLGVSRQPVRDAFSRLAHLDLLHIRPQRPTLVRSISMEAIEDARFVRLAIELEVVTRAHSVWNAQFADHLQQNLDQQKAAVDAGEWGLFHELDYDFHKLLCACSGMPRAFHVIESSKRKVDRLCVLGLEHADVASDVFDDHQQIARALEDKAVEGVRDLTRAHLSRLDDTIQDIRKTHSDFFD